MEKLTREKALAIARSSSMPDALGELVCMYADKLGLYDMAKELLFKQNQHPLNVLSQLNKKYWGE